MLDRSLEFYSYGHDRSGHRYQTRQFSLYYHSEIYISYTRFPQRSYFKGCERIKSTPKPSLLFLSNNSTTPSSKHATTSSSRHDISSLSKHATASFFLCLYITSTLIYAPRVVQHYPHIPPLGYLHKSTIRIPSSMLPHLFPPKARVPYSKSTSEHRRNNRNQRLNEKMMKNRKALSKN